MFVSVSQVPFWPRRPTPNSQPRFARLALDLLDEVRTGGEPARVIGAEAVPGYGSSVNGQFCTAVCEASAAAAAAAGSPGRPAR